MAGAVRSRAAREGTNRWGRRLSAASYQRVACARLVHVASGGQNSRATGLSGTPSGRHGYRRLLPYQGVDRREPTVGVLARAVDHSEEFFLQPLGDGAAPAAADGDPVDGADRRDFGGGAAEENFVGDVEHLAGNDGLHHGDADFAGQRDDAFGGSVGDGFHFDELRVHVIGAGLGERGQRVGGQAAPTGDADVDAFGEGLFAQILAPGPAGDEEVDGVLHAVDTHLPVAAHHDGAQVAGVHLVNADHFQHGFGKLIGGVTDILHAVNFGGIQHAADVLAQAEHGRSGRGGITANAFEYATAIAHHMREDVDGGGLPGNEAAVMPDLFSRRQHE